MLSAGGRTGETFTTREVPRHPGAEGHVVIYLPRGYMVRAASGPYRQETQPSGAALVHLQLTFETGSARWSLGFK